MKRHIHNVHGGGAFLVSFVDYLVGRQAGYYFPSLPPTYEIKPRQKIDYRNIIEEELLRDMIRKYLESRK